MKFRTEVNIPDSERKILLNDQVFSIGSCFSTEMSELLSQAQLQTFNNPFGTLFNPHSVANAVQRIHDAAFYTHDDLITFGGDFMSLDHHTGFNTRYAHHTLEKINTQIETANTFLQKTNWVLITYGSSFVYEFTEKSQIVANCHKIPGEYFEQKLLSHSQLVSCIATTIADLTDICQENVQVLFTVSPVRHTKDGIVENNLSKAKLITALHEVIGQYNNCHYLPVYEIMMDDLRDYRFYKEDLIHPNAQAVKYIFEKFGNSYFSDETMDYVEENLKIYQGLQHRSADREHPKYLAFLKNLDERITNQQKKVNHAIFTGFQRNNSHEQH